MISVYDLSSQQIASMIDAFNQCTCPTSSILVSSDILGSFAFNNGLNLTYVLGLFNNPDTIPELQDLLVYLESLDNFK